VTFFAGAAAFFAATFFVGTVAAFLATFFAEVAIFLLPLRVIDCEKRTRYAHASTPDSTSAFAFCANLLCVTVTVCCVALTTSRISSLFLRGKRDRLAISPYLSSTNRQTQRLAGRPQSQRRN
jgi:hypothetical protein